MNNVLEKMEAALLSKAEPVTPEGTEPRAVVHQWLHAIAHNLPLFAKSRGIDKASLIQALEQEQLFKDPTSFRRLLTAELPIAPPHDAQFSFIDLFAGIGGMRIGAQNNGGAKESISPSGARTRLTICRDSDSSLLIFNPQKMSAQHQL